MTVGRSFLDFDGRWVVVTGASSGLGRACAIELSAHGARTLLIGRNEERLENVRASLTGTGHRSIVLDLRQLDVIGPAITRAIDGAGRVYGLCHAAGVVTTRPLSANTVDVVQDMMTVNLLAGLELARIVARRDVMEPD